MPLENWTVLIVDDDDAIRENLGAFFDRAGVHVVSAADGAAALVQVAVAKPDLVILDVMMPELNGRQVLRALRAGGDWTPVILLTRTGESSERATAIEEGADDYLNKPFDPQELLARSRAVLRRRGGQVEPLQSARSLRSGPLSVDRTARSAALESRLVTLTPKAYALLDYLITHPGEVFSRDFLLNEVWGYQFAVATRAVDHRIAEIRRALADDPDAPRFVETIPRGGYRFCGLVERA
ncbi:response regulator transcription factor [Herbiconiux sp. CPCC 203407]|uniref:Response regulator transcription factor n=1 Tax=Herbiconiux oxytropis TaxID=2970915 RepID=A0AA41XJY9_9MICO|nr:response regulator transcription factor [Herbiconiux oxytropis]MCS5723020.1 response regulator transcription factor [Herbiconiux oxytropis]MCS5726911.1 response regulator transcription factor [Herbiconiux oxytropis]